jgi:hypothetical protein
MNFDYLFFVKSISLSMAILFFLASLFLMTFGKKFLKEERDTLFLFLIISFLSAVVYRVLIKYGV